MWGGGADVAAPAQSPQEPLAGGACLSTALSRHGFPIWPSFSLPSCLREGGKGQGATACTSWNGASHTRR